MRTLKNGDEIEEEECERVLRALKALRNEQNIAFYEIVTKARYQPDSFKFYESSGGFAKLQELGLLEVGGTIRASVRAVVLSAVTGAPSALAFVSPYP